MALREPKRVPILRNGEQVIGVMRCSRCRNIVALADTCSCVRLAKIKAWKKPKL